MLGPTVVLLVPAPSPPHPPPQNLTSYIIQPQSHNSTTIDTPSLSLLGMRPNSSKIFLFLLFCVVCALGQSASIPGVGQTFRIRRSKKIGVSQGDSPAEGWSNWWSDYLVLLHILLPSYRGAVAWGSRRWHLVLDEPSVQEDPKG